jgi:hypothetical protein
VGVRHEDQPRRVARVEVQVGGGGVEAVRGAGEERAAGHGGRVVRRVAVALPMEVPRRARVPGAWRRPAHAPRAFVVRLAPADRARVARSRFPARVDCPRSLPRRRTRRPVFADTLLTLERAHLLRLLVWAAGSVLAGSLLLALVALRRAAGPTALLRHFAIQTAAWGAVDLAIVAWAWRGLALRDFAGARALDRFLWLNLGLDVGYVAVGVTLALTAWLAARRLGPVGAGLGVAVQGAGLLVVHALFATRLAPYL